MDNNEDLPNSTRDVLRSIPDLFEDMRHLWNNTPSERNSTSTPSSDRVETPSPRPIHRVTPYVAPRIGHDIAYMSPQVAQHSPPVAFLHAHIETQIHILTPSMWQFFVFGRIDYSVGNRIIAIDICVSRFVSV